MRIRVVVRREGIVLGVRQGSEGSRVRQYKDG